MVQCAEGSRRMGKMVRRAGRESSFEVVVKDACGFDDLFESRLLRSQGSYRPEVAILVLAVTHHSTRSRTFRSTRTLTKSSNDLDLRLISGELGTLGKVSLGINN